MALRTLDEINKTDIVDYLATIGIHPEKIHGNQFYYRSPLRDESNPSFKVNRNLNRWWDFGTGEGSTLVDFGLRYYNCTIRELREKFGTSGLTPGNVPQHYPMGEIEAENTISIVRIRPLESFALLHYLDERRIPFRVAQKYLMEADYTFAKNKKKFYALALPNDAGGYELRNPFAKYSVAPKAPTLIKNNSQDIAVVGGMFNMLTLATFLSRPDKALPDFLSLNSSALFDSALPLMEPYRNKYLFMDNDKTDDKLVAAALKKDPSYHDMRVLYKAYNDPNDWARYLGKKHILPVIADPPLILPYGLDRRQRR